MFYEYNILELGFNALWNPGIIVLTLLLAAIYCAITGPVRHLFSHSESVPTYKRGLFLGGLFVFYLAFGSPLSVLGHDFLFSAHMLQQALLYMIVPPLLLLGIPAWLVRPLFDALQRSRKRKMLLSFFTHPIIALLLFNVLFSFYHLPMIFDFVSGHSLLHFSYHALLFLTAFQVWWPITCPLPELNHLSELRKMVFLVANGVLLYPACGLIIFADILLYNSYSGAPQVFLYLPPIEDQQLGGIVMKLIQEFSYITAIAFIFYQWYRRENANGAIDPMEPHDYERSMDHNSSKETETGKGLLLTPSTGPHNKP